MADFQPVVLVFVYKNLGRRAGGRTLLAPVQPDELDAVIAYLGVFEGLLQQKTDLHRTNLYIFL